ncbi:MAG: helix-turn-helix transcriptional regulator, partial [Oscillospiraceae bacterium]|nr:helix-turn-helix transcriptional regulator [Oscillospiraceae bacterium]
MELGNKIRQLRYKAGLTQEQLAERLGVGAQAVSKWESGTAYPETEKLIQISKIFNTSLDELINDNIDNS